MLQGRLFRLIHGKKSLRQIRLETLGHLKPLENHHISGSELRAHKALANAIAGPRQAILRHERDLVVRKIASNRSYSGKSKILRP